MYLCHARTLKLLVIQAEGASPTHYYEVDFPEVTKKKAAIIANREALHKLVGPSLDVQDIGKLDESHRAVLSNMSTMTTACLHWHCHHMTVTCQLQPFTLNMMPVPLTAAAGTLLLECDAARSGCRARKDPDRALLFTASRLEGPHSATVVPAGCWLPAEHANLCPFRMRVGLHGAT